MPRTEISGPGHTGAYAGGAYGSGYHVPVLCTAVVSGLVTDFSGVYLDGTVGGGGHAAALLDALGPEGRLIGIDRDADALAEVSHRLRDAQEGGRLLLVRGDFGAAAALVREAGFPAVDGMLLDLGVSSRQLEDPRRGFSHRTAGPLDMRMDDRAGMTADDVVNAWDERALWQVLGRFGEEPRSRRLARAIVSARPVLSTRHLAGIVRESVSPADAAKTLARVFQAIRIAVNTELESLERALVDAGRIVRPGGRIAVISYHSLEDRRVKRFLRYGNFEGRPDRDLMGNRAVPWREVNRRPVEPDETETGVNPRARSARLRIAERTEIP